MIAELLRLYEQLADEYMRRGNNSELVHYLHPVVFEKIKQHITELTRYSLSGAHPISDTQIEYHIQAGRQIFRKAEEDRSSPRNTAARLEEAINLMNMGVINSTQAANMLASVSNWTHLELPSPDRRECPDCFGGGMIARLYPSGHSEIRCETCNGNGFLD